MHPPIMPKTRLWLPWTSRVLQEVHQGFHETSKPLTLLTWQQVRFDWTPTHHEAILKLKESIIVAPIHGYPQTQQEVHSPYRCIR